MLYGAKRLSPTLFIIITQVRRALTTIACCCATLCRLSAPQRCVQTKLLTAALFAFILLRRTFSSLRYVS
jgi:hypothetical protein